MNENKTEVRDDRYYLNKIAKCNIGRPSQFLEQFETFQQELIEYLAATPPLPAKGEKGDERFKKPINEQIIKAALLFADGNLDDKGRLADMVGLCLWVVDRLYENGDILIPSSKENNNE